MSEMFIGCTKFNQSLNDWDVSQVTKMNSLFCGCLNYNKPLNKWVTSNVTNMKTTFKDCIKFNQPLNNWNVSNVENMAYMFKSCWSFNQPLNSWIINQRTNISNMFEDCGITEENKPTINTLPPPPPTLHQPLPPPPPPQPINNTVPIIQNTNIQTQLLKKIENQAKSMIENNQPVIQKYTNPVNLNLDIEDPHDLTYDDNLNKIEGLDNLNGFLNHSSDNIVFVYENKLYFFDKTTIQKTLNICF
jgi:surface protein